MQRIYRTKYSRTDQMRFVEDSLKSGPSEICGRQPLKNLKWFCWSRPYHFKFFKGCLPQISLGTFLNTLSQIKEQRKISVPIASITEIQIHMKENVKEISIHIDRKKIEYVIYSVNENKSNHNGVHDLSFIIQMKYTLQPPKSLK